MCKIQILHPRHLTNKVRYSRLLRWKISPMKEYFIAGEAGDTKWRDDVIKAMGRGWTSDAQHELSYLILTTLYYMCILQSSFNRWRNYKKTNKQKTPQQLCWIPHNNCAEYHTSHLHRNGPSGLQKEKKIRETLTSFPTVFICKMGIYKGDKAIFE